MKTTTVLRTFIMVLAFTFSCSFTMAQDWVDELIKAKREILGMSNTNGEKDLRSFTSKVKYHKDAAEKIKIDVKGLDCMALYTLKGPDRQDYDHGLWGNAFFTTDKGEKVYLDEMPFEYEETGQGDAGRNINLNARPLSINNVPYERGVVAHANSEIIVLLNKRFVSFEAEIGVDTQGGDSKESSVVFAVSPNSPRLTSKQLSDKFPVQVNLFNHYSGVSATEWLLNEDGSVERDALQYVVDKLEDGYNFINEMKLVEGNDPVNVKIRKYLTIFFRAVEVLQLQEELKLVDIYAVRAAFNNMKTMKGYDAAANEAKVNELEKIIRSGLIAICYYDANKIKMARRAIQLKKEILLSNPLLNVDKIVASRYKLGNNARSAGSSELGIESNNWSNIMSIGRRGHKSEIVELSNIRGNKYDVRTIFKPQDKVPVSHLHLNWNADKVMFSTINDRGLWNVFEVGVDGSNPKEVINVNDEDLEFFDGTYLPNGKIVAMSNIGYQGVPCVNGGDPVANMVLYDPAQKSLRRMTFDQDANWSPVVMNNGKIMYVRWEYGDLTHYFSRIVMHMNPDGTEAKALYGSNKFFPNSTFDVQPLPGFGSKFISVISGHHGVGRAGRLMIFDPAKGRKSVDGLVQEIPFSRRVVQPLIKDELVENVWPQFLKPYPISESYFLVAAKPSPESLWGIYLVDVFDNMTLIAEAEGEGFSSPMIVEKRPTPPIIPDRVKLDETESTVFIQDIYEGEGLSGVPRGTVKELRLFAYEYAYISSPSDHTAQGIQAGWDIKRLLGTVKVEEDGSATFKMPANTPISMQPLDSEGRAMQWMRSWVTGMPGEVVSCIGCHENQNQIPMPKKTIASTKAPMAITPPEGGAHSISFDLDVQPILTRACVACHNENSGHDYRPGRKDPETGFSMSYLRFHPYISRQGPEADAVVMTPYEYHASTSEMVRLLKNGHHGVKLTDDEWKKLYTWIDLNAPDKGGFEQNDLNGQNQIKRRMELANKYNNIKADWQQEMRDYAAYVASKGEIVPVKPAEVAAPVYKDVKVPGFPFTAEQAKAMVKSSDARKEIEIAPGVMMNFVRIPAGTYVMGSNKAGKNAAPESRVKIEKAFWMSEMEVSNEQFQVVYPNHDNRIIAQAWKDHTNAGYMANRPGQPVIRVAWESAMAYCKELGAKLGVKMNLPTEAQWEWAARAGSASDFWFGNLNNDFGKFENMADMSLNKLAVSGIDPQPMSSEDSWYKYYNYHPKSADVNDNQMIVIEGGYYEANPWGLYDMNGNVAEWTRSDYLPYPYLDNPKTKAELKVVRGGSWIDRSKNSTAYTRKYYLPWQKVNNVGFRVIIED